MKNLIVLLVLFFWIQNLVYSNFNYDDYIIEKTHYLEKNVLYEFKNITDWKLYLKNTTDWVISKWFNSFFITENINWEISYAWGNNSKTPDYNYTIIRNWKVEYETQKGHWITDNLEYSPNGTHLFFKTSIDSKKSEYWQAIIVMDWKEIWTEYDSAYSPTFSWDWKAFFYIWANNILNWWKNRISYIIKDWKVIEKSNYAISDLKVSKDWKKYAYLIFEWWLRKVVYNWVKSSYMQWNVWNYGFSNDWQNFAFYSTNDWRWIIVKDWKDISKKYASVDDFRFSTTWNWFSFIANTLDDKQILVKDWNEIKEDGLIGWFLYWKKSNDYIYLVRKNWKTYINNNWQKGIEYDSILYDSLVYNNSENYHFIAKKNNKLILINNWVEYWKFDNFIWFPIKDNKWNIAIIWKNDTNSIVIVNWKEIDSFSSWWLLRIYFVDDKIFIKQSINNKDNVFIKEFYNIKESQAQITNNLSEKDLKVVLNVSNTIKKFSISKQNQYKKALLNLLLKQKEWTRNFELIKAILEKIK